MLVNLGRGMSGGISSNNILPINPPTPFSLFEYDTNTLFFDLENRDNAVINTTGNNTLAVLPEVIHGDNKLVQEVKDLQPLTGTNGIQFNKDTDRALTFHDFSNITKGTNGYYVAFNVKFDSGNSFILSISRHVSSIESRGALYMTGSRNIGFKADDADGGSPNWIGYTSAQLTYGQWYTIEMELIADGITTNPLKIWVNGVQQALSGTNTNPFASFPNSSPSQISIGNDASGGESLDGEIQNFIFQNGLVSSNIKTSVRNYLQGVKP